MILATYLPCKKSKIKNIKCFAVETPEDLMIQSIRFQPEEYAEELVVFQVNQAKEKNGYYYVKELPDIKVCIMLAGIILGDAFVMNEEQREFEPALQNSRRKKSNQYIDGQMDQELEDEEGYKQFLQLQKSAFEAFFMPLWAPILISKFSGKHFPIDTNAELTPAEISYFTTTDDWSDDKLLHAYYSKGLNANDMCWCGSGKKMKKCHGGRSL